MLKHWSSHAEYQLFISETVSQLNETQLIRSFVLMMDQKILNLTQWVNELSQDVLLAMLIGCPLDSLPPLGSYYDFVNRLWQQNSKTERFGRKILFPAGKNKKPKLKPKKGKKLPNRHSGITNTVADFVFTH